MERDVASATRAPSRRRGARARRSTRAPAAGARGHAAVAHELREEKRRMRETLDAVLDRLRRREAPRPARPERLVQLTATLQQAVVDAYGTVPTARLAQLHARLEDELWRIQRPMVDRLTRHALDYIAPDGPPARRARRRRRRRRARRRRPGRRRARASRGRPAAGAPSRAPRTPPPAAAAGRRRRPPQHAHPGQEVTRSRAKGDGEREADGEHRRQRRREDLGHGHVDVPFGQDLEHDLPNRRRPAGADGPERPLRKA